MFEFNVFSKNIVIIVIERILVIIHTCMECSRTSGRDISHTLLQYLCNTVTYTSVL